MQLNKLLKGLAIALPLFTLAACSSSSDSDAAGAESGMTDGMGGVQTGGANGRERVLRCGREDLLVEHDEVLPLRAGGDVNVVSVDQQPQCNFKAFA